MIMTWIPNNVAPSNFAMIPAHMPSTKIHNNAAPSEQILTAPELRSMGQSDLDNDAAAGCFSTGVLLHTSDDYNSSYTHRDAQFHVTAGPPTMPSNAHSSHMPYSPNAYHYRPSYQPSTAHQQHLETSRYMYMVNELDQVVSPSVNSTIEVSAPVRGAPTPFRSRRTQSLEVHPTVSSINMSDTFPYGGFYGNSEVTHSSLPGSPSPSLLETLPAQPTQEPEFLPSLVVDGQPHPFFLPMPNTAAEPSTCSPAIENQSTKSSPSPSSSPSPLLAFSTSFQSNFSSSSFSSPSNCNSPSLSSVSTKTHRKRFSTGSIASCSSIDTMFAPYPFPSAKAHASGSGGSAPKKPKQRYVCHVPDCNRTFSRPYNLKSHGLTHDAHRPHACGKCSKTFARIHDRDRHMNSHMPQKPHVCIVCMGRFARQDAVIRHLKLSNETNACAWILKGSSVSFRDAAAGRVTREALGDENYIRQTLERLEEDARKTRASRTLELMGSAATSVLLESEQQQQQQP
ncbi:hypothetical protein EDD11_010508 [Mortierella claussenii]|nr:hypothetical protein EDD11_010508 [Mortierella claussenii]